MLRFDSPLQVEPEAAMTVTFRARRQRIRQFDPGVYYGFGLFAGLLAIGGLGSFVRLRWNLLHEILTPAPRPALQAESVEPEDPDEPDEPNDQVSAEELI